VELQKGEGREGKKEDRHKQRARGLMIEEKLEEFYSGGNKEERRKDSSWNGRNLLVSAYFPMAAEGVAAN